MKLCKNCKWYKAKHRAVRLDDKLKEECNTEYNVCFHPQIIENERSYVTGNISTTHMAICWLRDSKSTDYNVPRCGREATWYEPIEEDK